MQDNGYTFVNVAIHYLGISHHPVLGDRCCCSSFLGSMVVARLVGTVYGAKSGNDDQDLPPLLLPPRKMVIASSPNGATRCDPVEWAWQGSKGLHHWEISPLSTCCFQQFGLFNLCEIVAFSDRLFYPPSGWKLSLLDPNLIENSPTICVLGFAVRTAIVSRVRQGV